MSFFTDQAELAFSEAQDDVEIPNAGVNTPAIQTQGFRKVVLKVSVSARSSSPAPTRLEVRLQGSTKEAAPDEWANELAQQAPTAGGEIDVISAVWRDAEAASLGAPFVRHYVFEVRSRWVRWNLATDVADSTFTADLTAYRIAE